MYQLVGLGESRCKMALKNALSWKSDRIAGIGKWLETNKRQGFIDDQKIEALVSRPSVLDHAKVAELIAKAKTLKGLAPEEAAYLMNLDDEEIS